MRLLYCKYHIYMTPPVFFASWIVQSILIPKRSGQATEAGYPLEMTKTLLLKMASMVHLVR
jgi:hypothetical protein